MAVNVTEKDKTLNEIIDWCEQLAAEGLRLASALLRQHDMAAYGVMRGQVNAYEKTADHCRSMLGYTGNMPTEVPNQSEDTKMNMRVRTTYLAKCDYPGCRMHYDFWAMSEKNAIMDSHVKLAVPFDDHETKTTKQSEDVK